MLCSLLKKFYYFLSFFWFFCSYPQPQRVDKVNRIIVAVEVVVRSVGVSARVASYEPTELRVVVSEAEVVESGGGVAFFRAELAGFVGGAGGSEFFSERLVVGGAGDRAGGVGHRDDGAYGVVAEVFFFLWSAVGVVRLGVEDGADAAAHACSADELFCQRARGVELLDVDPAVVNIVCGVAVFNFGYPPGPVVVCGGEDFGSVPLDLDQTVLAVVGVGVDGSVGRGFRGSVTVEVVGVQGDGGGIPGAVVGGYGDKRGQVNYGLCGTGRTKRT